METKPQQVPPILEVAWKLYAQLDVSSTKRAKSQITIRRWIAVLGILTTLFVILTEHYSVSFSPLGKLVLKIFFIALPIASSILAAFVNKFFSSGDYLVIRAGAEEILKEIYTYRTILQESPQRRAWLEKRLEEIQRSVYRGMNGLLILEPYKGTLPPYANYPDSDPGFNDLTGTEYFHYRLENQFNWHNAALYKRQQERTHLQWLILISGGVGALFAAWGDPLTLWVALSASFTSALLGWQELRSLDFVVQNYSKVIMELSILFNHWKNLESEEQTQTEFYKTVRSTENVLWRQNKEFVKALHEALEESDLELEKEAGLINRVIQEQRDSDQRLKQDIQDAIVEQATVSMEESRETITETFKEVLGSLAEEASSELVQAELASMQAAIQDAMENIAERMGLSSSLKTIDEEFEGVEIGSNTPMSVLNDLISRYPKTTDVKG